MRWIFVFFILTSFASWSQEGSGDIKLNQIGFYPGTKKMAVTTAQASGDKFYILSSNEKDTVYRGTLSEKRQSAYSSTQTRIADFSDLRKTGNYFVFVPGIGKSYAFRIADHVTHDLAVSVLKGFYFMRSNIPLDKKYAGKWARPPGHPDTAVEIHPSAASEQRPAGTIISTPGGWYDAGDYNKYIVNSGISVGTLLSAWEDFPDYFKNIRTNIPESADAIPDILNEALYNLRWMRTMQDPNDGGVYHKCTNAIFDGWVMPGVTKAPRYVVQKSTAAALDFAAVMAQSARIFSKFKLQLPGLSDSCLTGAKKAWEWAKIHPQVLYNQREMNNHYDPDILTGDYGDRHIDDEWLWAAAELFVTTNSPEYFSVVKEKFNQPASTPSWGNVTMLAYYTFLRSPVHLSVDGKLILQSMKDTVLRLANAFISKSASNAFATVMGQNRGDFVWGSNAVAANQGILLINTYQLTHDKKYLEGALSNLDYILGKNATGYCFVTGAGKKSPMHPHHRPSVADGIEEPVPGLLVGGPNPGRQDNCPYPFTEAETSYVDSDCAYAANEIAINWNAPMVYLAHAIEALVK
ncbi:MAG: glycoside hydrolase family 9 protein [Flavisolibacter sp.]